MNKSAWKPALLLAALMALVGGFGCRAEAQESIPESGRWVTASGNLEVEIAPCGDALCGTVTRVLANNAMPAGTMQPLTPEQQAALVGQAIMTDLRRTAQGELQGKIYNRSNGKTYNCKVGVLGPTQLKLFIFEGSPASGQTQVWNRAERAQN